MAAICIKKRIRFMHAGAATPPADTITTGSLLAGGVFKGSPTRKNHHCGVPIVPPMKGQTGVNRLKNQLVATEDGPPRSEAGFGEEASSPRAGQHFFMAGKPQGVFAYQGLSVHFLETFGSNRCFTCRDYRRPSGNDGCNGYKRSRFFVSSSLHTGGCCKMGT